MSSILRRAVYPAMSRAGVFSRSLRAGEVCALTYHGVLPEGFISRQSPTDETLVSGRRFREQVRFLKSRYELITPEAFRSWCAGEDALPERALLLTCDDGLLNVLTEMVPILEEERAQCLFFVTGSSTEDGAAYLWYEELFQMLESARREERVAACREWVEAGSACAESANSCWQVLMKNFSRLGGEDRRTAIERLRTRLGAAGEWRARVQSDVVAERRYRLLNRTELRKVAAAGMTIGAHTMSHPMLSEMTAELMEYEIRECRSRLETCLEQEVWALAYPFGDERSAGHREVRAAENAAFKCAFMNGGGGAFGRTAARFTLPRTHVTSAMEIPELEARLTGFFEPIRKRVRAAAAPGKGE